jgi:hypothetical protein
LLVAGLTALYAGALGMPFLNDDYLFLEEARTRPLAASLSDLGPLSNYYRPLSRQIYFEVLTPLAGSDPRVFHAFNFALFLMALALLGDLLRSRLPVPGVFAGVLAFALMPFQRVNLMWISCSQDLLALVGTLAAVALNRRDRWRFALVAFAAAVASKESALPLPIALVAWDLSIGGRPWPVALRRAAPFAVVAIAWMVVILGMRATHAAAAPLDFSLSAFAAAFAHLGQSLLGFDHPAGWFAAMAAHGPSLVPLLCLSIAAFLAGRGEERSKGASAPTAAGHSVTNPRALAGFALVWLAAFALPTGPVAYGWSSYYYTLAAVGAAVLVGLACARADRWVLLALSAALVWWHAGGTGTRAFSVAQSPWSWTSHLTPFYFSRAAALTDTFSRQLVRLEPLPPHRTRFFFATLPSWAGFQMGNGLGVGGERKDHLYWLGWAELWRGDRPAAEAAWMALGAVDDSLEWRDRLRAAHNALVYGDTLESRRQLIRAIEAGMGRPEAHSILGELLMSPAPKYGLLELKVASWLDPQDVAARRRLALGLDQIRLDEAARRELESLWMDFPRLRGDSAVARAWRRHTPRPRASVIETREATP